MAGKLGVWGLILTASWLTISSTMGGEPGKEDVVVRMNKCPHGDYCPVHYWMPAWYRLRSQLFGPAPSMFAANPDAEMKPTYRIIRYPCPPVDPVDSAAAYGAGQIHAP